MSDLFDRLFLLPQQNLYSEGSPLLVEAGALYRNTRTGGLVAQLKFMNVSPKPIKAVTVTLFLSDYAGRPTDETVMYRYLDLNVARDQSFGMQTPIRIHNPEARGFSVRVNEVVSSDNAIWSPSTESSWISLPVQQSSSAYFSDPDLDNQYHTEHGKAANYIPQRFTDLWRCACGAINRTEETCCHACGHTFFEHTDADTGRLRTEIEQREAMARAEVERQKAIAQAELERQKAITQAELERREAMARAEAERKAIQAEEARARRMKGFKRFRRIFGRLLCAALAILSVYLLTAFPAVRLSGKGLADFMTDVDWQVTDSLSFTRDKLLHSDSFDREAITAAGVDLSEKNVVSTLDGAEPTIRALTDGDLSLEELLRGALLAQKLLPVADGLFSTDATFGLFKTLGIKDNYEDFRSAYASYHQIAAWALIGFEAFLCLMGLFALGSVLMSLFGKRRVFDVLLLIAEILVLLLFCGVIFFGTPLLVGLGMPSKLKLLPCLAPMLSIPALIVMLIVKRVTLGKRRKVGA